VVLSRMTSTFVVLTTPGVIGNEVVPVAESASLSTFWRTTKLQDAPGSGVNDESPIFDTDIPREASTRIAKLVAPPVASLKRLARLRVVVSVFLYF